MEKKNLLIIDGMALLFRGYFGFSYGGFIRKTRAGLPTNAIYGFMKYFLQAVNILQPSHVACCWDLGSTTFRTKRYQLYKANRPEPPEALIPQFDLIKEVVSRFDVPNISYPDYEADDCIGTVASLADNFQEVHIITGDHDMLQLVSDKVKVVFHKKGPSPFVIYDQKALFAEKQLSPAQIIDLKALTGDSSDNYPGVKGIGEKSAVKLLQEFKSIEGILDNLDQLTKGLRTKIENDLDMLHLCRDLATIRQDVPVTFHAQDAIWDPNLEEITRLFEELEFVGLMKEIPFIYKAS